MTPADVPQKPAARGPALRDGLILAATVGVVGVVFGVLARTSGLSLAKTCAMSLLVFTGASQFAAASVINGGGSSVAALGPALLLASRNALYGPVVARFFDDDSVPRRLALAHVVIDESTGVGAAQSERSEQRIGFLSSGIGIYVFWNLGTLLGATVGDFIGNLEQWGLDAAFPAVYVALLAPHLASHPGRVSALIAAAIALATVPVLPIGIPILISTVGAAAGAIVAHRSDLVVAAAQDSP